MLTCVPTAVVLDMLIIMTYPRVSPCACRAHVQLLILVHDLLWLTGENAGIEAQAFKAHMDQNNAELSVSGYVTLMSAYAQVHYHFTYTTNIVIIQQRYWGYVFLSCSNQCWALSSGVVATYRAGLSSHYADVHLLNVLTTATCYAQMLC